MEKISEKESILRTLAIMISSSRMHVWEFAIFKFVTLFAIISTGAHCNILNTQQILRVSDDTAFIIRYKNQLSALEGYF